MGNADSIDDAARRWLDQAQYDLETARSMLEAKRYVYVLFCCQQAVEKRLKGRIAQNTGKLPPRSHNLAALADAASVALDEPHRDFLRELSAYYVQSRYPDEMNLAGNVARDLAKEVLHRTEEFVKWLSSTT